MKSNWPIEKIGLHIKQTSIRNKSDSPIDVYSVTNSKGFVKSTDYFSKEVFSVDTTNYKIVEKNDFAYNPSRINVGSIDYLKVSESALVSPLYVTFRTNQTLNNEYLLRFLKSGWGLTQIKSNTEGAVRDSLKFKGLENINIPVPDLSSQIRIATLLSRVETLIATRKDNLRLLDEFLKATFLEMFGDPIRNQKGYNVSHIEDVTTHIKDGPHVSPEYAERGFPIYSTRNIRPGRLVLDEIKFVSRDTFEKLTKQFKPQKGDVLLTKGGTTGFAKAVDFEYEFCVWVHLAILRPNSKVIPLYLEHALNSDYCYWQSQKLTKGIANRDLGLKRIARIRILVPPKELQNQFAKIVEKTESLKTHYQQNLTELENLYAALSQQAFKGELDLSRVPLPEQAIHHEGHEDHEANNEKNLRALRDLRGELFQIPEQATHHEGHEDHEENNNKKPSCPP